MTWLRDGCVTGRPSNHFQTHCPRLHSGIRPFAQFSAGERGGAACESCEMAQDTPCARSVCNTLYILLGKEVTEIKKLRAPRPDRHRSSLASLSVPEPTGRKRVQQHGGWRSLKASISLQINCFRPH